jgi:hypothetical protein
LLLVGGIQCLRSSSSEKGTLVFGCGLAIGYEAVRTIVQVIIQVQAASLTGQHMQRMMEAAGGKTTPAFAEIMTASAKVGMVVGAGFTVCWAIAKVVFYVLTIRQLRKPEGP